MSQKQKNIVIFLCDQMRRNAIGAYGTPGCQTPNLDAFAENGIRFNRAYSTYPICVPFRHTFMTGVSGYQAQVPAFNYTIPEDRRTLADEFNDAGYQTALFGKWHLSAQTKGGIPRENQGRWETFVYSDGYPKYDGLIEFTDPRNGNTRKDYDTDLFTDLAIEWLDKKRDTDKPFCLNVSLSGPHDVKRPHVDLYSEDPLGKPDKFFYRAPEKYMEKWKNKEINLPPNFIQLDDPEHQKFLLDANRGYMAMIEHLDDAFGRFINYLKESGLYEDTIIVFLSDHGDLLGSHFAKHKGLPYEESNGIPFIVNGPGVSAHRSINSILHTEDFFPTILGLCNLKPAQELSGKDASPIVYGESESLDRDGAFLEFHREDREDFKECHPLWKGYVNDRYKYAVLVNDEGETEPWLLFDLHNDPWEQNNLIENKEYDSIRQELHTKMVEQMSF